MSSSAVNPSPPTASDRWQGRFFTVWTGQALSLVGSSLTQFVLLWWITQTTGSAGALAIAGMMALLPQALLGPLGGTLADRLSRRVIMIVADAVTALCMVVLVLLFATNSVQLWHVYTLMFVRSCMQAFQTPAASASTAMLVPQSWLGRVAGMNQTLQGVMTIASAPLGALALAWLPLQGALLIDVVTALLGIVPLFFYRIPQPTHPEAEAGGVWQDFRAGLQLVVRNPGLLRLYGLLAVVVLAVMPTFTLTPLLVKQHFGGGVNQVALMEGLAGAGMIAGGVLVTVWPLFRRCIVTVLVALTASCLTLALTGLAPANGLWLAVVWWTLSGLAFSVGSAPLTAILQSVVPLHMQGRALSLLSTVMGLAGPVGLAIAGPLGEATSVRGVFIVGGAVATVACLSGFFSRRLLRVEEAPEQKKPSAPAAEG